MKVADLFGPRCIHCAGADHLITEDGPTVCWMCVQRFGRAAGDPESLSYGEARMLQEAHGDVLRLGQRPGPIELEAGGRWRTRVELAWVWHDDMDPAIQRRLDALGGTDR